MISLLAPAYNEEDVIREFVASLMGLSLQEDWELVIVNDGSTDKTGAILSELSGTCPNLRVVTHKKNKNLGGALKSGFAVARGRAIVTMDADMTHPPALIGHMVAQLQDNDVCIASRYVTGGGMKGVPLHRRFMSRLANILYRLLFLSPVWDNTGGFRAYRAQAIRDFVIEERGFVVQLEIMTKLLKRKARFKEIPFVLKNRDLGFSKLNYLQTLPVYVGRVWRLLALRWGRESPAL